jgi:hypothetical protein
MSALNILVVDGKPIEGVYSTLDFGTYKKLAWGRGQPLTACATCGLGSKHDKEDGVELKVCKGCFCVAFCSKKCQVTHWPSHKKECGPSVLGSIINETVGRFLSHPFLLHYLRVALIEKLAVDLCAKKINPKECYHVVIYLNFHPISSEHEIGLVLGRIDPKGQDKIRGFLRLEIPDRPVEQILVNIGKGGLTKHREGDTVLIRLWRLARKHTNSIGHEGNLIVMVGFGYENMRHDYGIEITTEAFATAKGAQNLSPVTALPPSIKPPPFPWNYDIVMFFIIMKYISLDEEDTLKLRRDLRRTDKQRLHGIGVDYFAKDAHKLITGSGRLITGSELDPPEDSRDPIGVSEG